METHEENPLNDSKDSHLKVPEMTAAERAQWKISAQLDMVHSKTRRSVTKNHVGEEVNVPDFYEELEHIIRQENLQ